MYHVYLHECTFAQVRGARLGREKTGGAGCGSGCGEAFHWLACDLGDDVEVLVEVQDGESGELCGGGDDQVRDRGGTVLAAVGQQGQDLDRTVLDRRGQVFHWHG